MKDRTDIAVVGAGAIGCYFGAMLARAGNDGDADRPSKARRADQPDGTASSKAPAARAHSDCRHRRTWPQSRGPAVLFCVKSLDTEDAARDRWRRTCAPDAVVLSLQNGVDNVERIRRHIKNQVIPVLVYAAAEMPEPGTVRHTGGGNLVIGRE